MAAYHQCNPTPTGSAIPSVCSGFVHGFIVSHVLCTMQLTTDPTSRLVFLAVTFCLVKVFFAIAYSNNGVFLNHAVPSTLRGVYVGMSHTIGAVFRFIVPPTASGLFAWVSQQVCAMRVHEKY